MIENLAAALVLEDDFRSWVADRLRLMDADASLTSSGPEREPVEPAPSIWDGEIPMPVSPR